MATVEAREALLGDLVALSPKAGPGAAAAARRAHAERALARHRLPTIKDEPWRFTPLTSLLAHRYQAPGPAAAVLLPEVSRFLLPEAEGQRLVFVDGRFAPALSSLAGTCPGLVLAPLSQLAALPAALGTLADVESDAFTALATHGLAEGAAVIVPEGLRCDRPVQLLFVSTGQAASYVVPRVLVAAGTGSAATVAQAFVCLAEGAYFVNAVTEVLAGDGAQVCHVRVQSESREATHVERLVASLGRDAGYHLHSITLGGRLSRLDAVVRGREAGMDASLNGLALLAGEQEADTHSSVVHARPSCRSRQLHKMVLDDRAHAVFGGKIVVEPQAQQTDSAQAARGLLLSDKARIDAVPELKIDADDVKCGHGVAIGQIDGDQLFYLKSRGIDEPTARDLLTYAFAAEVIDQIPLASLRKQLQAVVVGRTDRQRREARP